MNILSYYHLPVGQNHFKMREFCLCLNVSWYVPTGLKGKQSTCMLNTRRQEVDAESPERFKCKMMRFRTSSSRIKTNSTTPNLCSQFLQQAATCGPTVSRTQEHNIEEGCAKRGCFMFNGYIDECALLPSLGHPVPRS